MKVGVLTNGGDVPGLTAAVAETMRTLRRAGAEPLGIRGGWSGLVGIAEGASLGDVTVDLDEGAAYALERVGGSMLGSSRTTLEDPRLREEVAAACMKVGVRVLVVFGGDGTLTSAADLSEAGMTVVGVPKTVDNDVSATPVSLGFATASDRAAGMLDAADDTGRTHRRCMVVELMGRGSGALTLRAAVSAGVPAVLPERPPSVEGLRRMLEERPYGAVAVAEGAFGWEAGREGPAPGHAAARLQAMLGRAGAEDMRTTVPGHLVRGGPPSPADRWLGRTFGRAGASAALELTSCLLASDGAEVWREPIGRAYEAPSRLAEKQLEDAAGLVVG